jgi:hypothetical protein
MPAFAFHLETGELWALSWPESEDRIENVRVWADDRLFVWGGWGGHPSGRPPGQGGFLYTPDW